MEKLTKSPRLNYLLGLMGIFTPYDVIYHLPYRYDDLSYTKQRNLLDKDKIIILGKVVSLPKEVSVKGLRITTFDFITTEKNYFKIVFFNRNYIKHILNCDDLFTIIGIYNKKKNEIDGINIYKGEIPPEERIKPVYSLVNQYPTHHFSSLVKKSLEQLENKIYSIIPYCYLNKYRLVNKDTAIKWAHFPSSYEKIHQALRHLKYEEALLFSLKNQLIREENKSLYKIKKKPIDLSICKPFLDTLDFTLTEDQNKACKEIIEDMNQNTLMYRLLQGDVGTGKTLVCFVCLYANYIRGDVGALMAPTDALARQHYENAKKVFAKTNLKIALLLGSTSEKDKKQIRDDLKDGLIDIIIGTHALFSKNVIYSSLGLVIIDEQHRFGVNQRIALASKGEHADLLMMSATPIPRSLALTLYGDLAVSTLFCFPNKKRQIVTKILNSQDKEIFDTVDQALINNKNIYIVAPLIDFSDDERYSVEKLYARYLLRYKNKVGLLHGKMKPEEKQEALIKFYNGVNPILVSTQVIEVGIDVKTANTMVIYDASHFGLASLHQLRGRIGRDGSLSTCLLTIDQNDKDAEDKLNILVKSNDGFEIAEEDMKQRGPGQLAGVRQSGLPDFAFLNIVDDYKIFVVAREDAKEIMRDKNNANYKWIIQKAKNEINTNEIPFYIQ